MNKKLWEINLEMKWICFNINIYFRLSGSGVEIVLGLVVKGGGGLGISLEGTVDVEEGGREVRPHHYIRSVLPEGPVGRSTTLRSGDELLGECYKLSTPNLFPFLSSG